VRRLYEWTQNDKSPVPDFMRDKIRVLYNNLADFSVAYDVPGAHRTSSQLDRMTRTMDRHLFNTVYFHGTFAAAQSSIRAWALFYNFTPSNPYTVRLHGGWQSPAERLNQFRYHDNWLQNLLISASKKSFSGSPPNPL